MTGLFVCIHGKTCCGVHPASCSVGKGKAIAGTGCEGPYGCEMSVPHFLHNQLTDGGKVVSLAHRLPFIPQEDSSYSFLLEVESPPGHSAAGRIR
jgi:hypothetical protein